MSCEVSCIIHRYPVYGGKKISTKTQLPSVNLKKGDTPTAVKVCDIILSVYKRTETLTQKHLQNEYFNPISQVRCRKQTISVSEI